MQAWHTPISSGSVFSVIRNWVAANRLVAQDLSNEHAWQLSQEFRLTSNFSGPLNFSVGGNYLHYETEENYYVFINALTILALTSVIQAATVESIPVHPMSRCDRTTTVACRE